MLITIRQIEIFLSIVQQKSIAAAAGHLHLSKPAISMALYELETRLGHQLFDRVKNRLVINYYGQQLLSKADELYQRTLEIEQIFNPDGPDVSSSLAGKLSIGGSNTIGNYLLPRLLCQFRQQTRHRQQSVVIDNSENICHKVAEYRVDIGLIEGYVQHKDLLFEFWKEDEMCIIAPVDHPLASQALVTLADLDNQCWVLRESGSGTRAQFMQMIAPALTTTSITLELTTTESIIKAVQNRLGLAFVSRLAVEAAVAAGQVALVNTHQPGISLKRQFWIVTHIEKYRNPLMARFIDIIQQSG